MAKDTTGSLTVFSAAGGLSDLPSVGGISNPGQPSIYPDIDMSNKSGDASAAASPAESYAGMSATTSAGMSAPVSLADAPTSPSSDLGNQMADGLSSVPTPSGSY